MTRHKFISRANPFTTNHRLPRYRCVREKKIEMDGEDKKKENKLSLKKGVKRLGVSKSVPVVDKNLKKGVEVLRKSERMSSSQKSTESVETTASSQKDGDRREENWEKDELLALVQGVKSNYDVLTAEHHGVGAKAKSEANKNSAWQAITSLVNQ